MVQNISTGQDSPTLFGKHVILRPFCVGDISTDYLRWLSDPEVVRFSSQRFRKHTYDSSLAYLNTFVDSGNLFMAITMAEGQQLVGTITAYCSHHHRTADMGLLIGDRRFWGQGIGLDSWSTLLDYLLYVRSLRKVTAGTVACNFGMIKVMERSGMYLEAVRSKQQLIDQLPQDTLHYAKFRAS